jgi:putative FmdB family regulatory protein
MPIYEFHCKKCSHTFDRFLSIANRDTPETEPCPECKELEVSKHAGRINMVQWEKNLRPDAEFTSLLKQIKKNNIRSNIEEKFGA